MAKEIELGTADASWMACLFSFFLDAPHPPFALNANTKEFSLKKLGTGLARSGTTPVTAIRLYPRGRAGRKSWKWNPTTQIIISIRTARARDMHMHMRMHMHM